MRIVANIGDFATRYDLAVVGAGPAGMAAATLAAALGAKTVLVDENASPGGQIYRALTVSPVSRRDRLGADYQAGEALARDFAASSSAYAPAAGVWNVGPACTDAGSSEGFEVAVSQGGAARLIGARQVILATGALERPVPIPGWTLPGVMTAGAAQIALKASGLVPDGPVVLAGTGPLLYLLAAQLIAAGASISALLDTTPRANWREAFPALPGFVGSPYFAKGLALLWRVRRAVRVVTQVSALAAEGEGRVARVAYERRGVRCLIACDLLLLHQGVVPNINLSGAIGCAHDWNPVQLAFQPRLDAWLASSVPGIAVAGDGAGIAGAESAAARGRLAALGAAHRLGLIDDARRDGEAASVRRDLTRLARGRDVLDRLYRPAKGFRVPVDADTIVCRCEEVSAGTLRDAVALGASGPNQMKAFTRCGMGPCQGRLCGLTVTELIAEARGVSPAEVGYYRLRPPVKPVTLAEIAALPGTDAAETAVVR